MVKSHYYRPDLLGFSLEEVIVPHSGQFCKPFAVLCITTLPPDRQGYARAGALYPPGARQRSSAHTLVAQAGAVYKPPSAATERDMDLTQLDYVAARDHMVDSQLRPNRIIDPRLIRAARNLPRERFLPPELAGMAYADEDIALPGGRNMMEPLVLANLIQLAKVRHGERVLVVGAGAGYGAALLDACGAQVTALEEDPALLQRARTVLPEVAPGVTIVDGKLTEGWPGPWDVILIEGAVPQIPATIGAQLSGQGGRLVTVMAHPPGLPRGVLAEAINPGAPEPKLRAQPYFDCATPLLPAFRLKPTFKF